MEGLYVNGFYGRIPKKLDTKAFIMYPVNRQ
jgi:hypothetical protein